MAMLSANGYILFEHLVELLLKGQVTKQWSLLKQIHACNFIGLFNIGQVCIA